MDGNLALCAGEKFHDYEYEEISMKWIFRMDQRLRIFILLLQPSSVGDLTVFFSLVD